MTLNFGLPEMFWSLGFLLLFITLFALALSKSSRLLGHMVASRLKEQLLKRVHPGRRMLKFALLCLAFIAIVGSLALPRLGEEEIESRWEGLDVLFVVDISRSMLAEDASLFQQASASRLEFAKLAGQDIAASLDGDRIGLVAFEGVAELRCPLTINYDEFVKSLQEVEAGTTRVGGTNITNAIKLGLEAFMESEGNHRAIVLITDGEELDENALEQAQIAEDQGVKIFTIGMGSVEGAEIYITDERGRKVAVRDPEGKVVKSKLEEKLLQEIAGFTNGLYLHYKGTNTVQKLIRDGLDKMKPRQLEGEKEIVPIERYQWPLGVGIILFLISILIPERPLKSDRTPAPVLPGGPRKRPAGPTGAAVVVLSGLLLAGGAGTANVHAASGAQVAYSKGDYSRALELYEDELEARANSAHRPKIAYGAGAAAYKAGQYDRAMKHFGLALTGEDDALLSKARYSLGNALFRKGQAAEADEEKVEIWKNALEQYEKAASLGLSRAKKNLEFVKAQIDAIKPPEPEEKEEKPEENQPDQENEEKQDPESGQEEGEKNEQEQQEQEDAESIAKDLQEELNRDQEEHVKEQQEKAEEQPQPPSEEEQRKQDQEQLNEAEEKVQNKLDELEKKNEPQEVKTLEQPQEGEQQQQPQEDEQQQPQEGEQQQQPQEGEQQQPQEGEQQQQPQEGEQQQPQTGESPSGKPKPDESPQENQGEPVSDSSQAKPGSGENAPERSEKMEDLRDLLEERLEKLKESQKEGQPSGQQSKEDLENIDESVREKLEEMVKESQQKGREKDAEKEQDKSNEGDPGEKKEDSEKSEPNEENTAQTQQEGEKGDKSEKSDQGQGEPESPDEPQEGELASAEEGAEGKEGEAKAQPIELEPQEMSREQAMQLLRQMLQQEARLLHQRRGGMRSRIRDW